MRINEVEQLNEGFGDYMRAGLYNKLGIGGQKGNAAANMYNFLDGFTQQYKQSINAAKEAGMPADPNKFIDSYLNRYGWQASKKQRRAMMGLVNDPSKLAKAMYSIGMQQNRDPQGYVTGKAAGAPAGSMKSAGQPQMNKQQITRALQKAQAELDRVKSGPDLNSTSQGVISSIRGLTGPDNLDDLAAITKAAMQTLYGQDKAKYNELYKEITTGQKADVSSAEEIAARRVEKLKAAAQAADAEATPFSKMPGSEPAPQPRTPDEFAARRLAKQKAAMSAMNNPAPAAQAAPAQEPAAQQSFNRPASSAVKSASGQELPTQPSMNPRQVPGALSSMNQQTSANTAPVAKKSLKKVTR